MVAPVQKVGRLGVPNRRLPEARIVGAVESHIFPTYFLWEDCDILVLGAENQPLPLEVLEILGNRQRSRPRVFGDCGVVDVVFSVDESHSGILYAVPLRLARGVNERLVLYGKIDPVPAPGYSDVAQGREELPPFVGDGTSVFQRHRGVRRLELQNIRDCSAVSVVLKPTDWRADVAFSGFAALRDSHQQNNFVAEVHSTRIKSTEHLVAVSCRLYIAGLNYRVLFMPHNHFHLILILFYKNYYLLFKPTPASSPKNSPAKCAVNAIG